MHKDDDLLFTLRGFLEGYEIATLLPRLKGKGHDRLLSRRQMMMLDKAALGTTLQILFEQRERMRLRWAESESM